MRGSCNCIPQNTVGCKYLSLPEITASEAKVLILTPVLCKCPTHNQTMVWFVLLNIWSSLYLETISEWDTWMNVSVFMSLTLISKPLSKQWSIFSCFIWIRKKILSSTVCIHTSGGHHTILCVFRSSLQTISIEATQPTCWAPFY